MSGTVGIEYLDFQLILQLVLVDESTYLDLVYQTVYLIQLMSAKIH